MNSALWKARGEVQRRATDLAISIVRYAARVSNQGNGGNDVVFGPTCLVVVLAKFKMSGGVSSPSVDGQVIFLVQLFCRPAFE